MFFLDFLRSSVYDATGANRVGGAAIWLGAQVNNKTFSGWSNGEMNDYNNPHSSEYNEDGLTCLCAAAGITDNYWYNYYCDMDYYLIACQRPSDWTISWY